MSATKRKTCGNCGVYRDLHPVRLCQTPRLSFWWDRHNLGRHIIGALWLAIPDRWRWSYAHHYADRHPEKCWCDIVNAAIVGRDRDDYRRPNGCLCDVPIPQDSRLPVGECYCPPVEGVV